MIFWFSPKAEIIREFRTNFLTWMTREVDSLRAIRYWTKQFNNDRTDIGNQTKPGNPVIDIS
jgi:hypothetical protein